MAEVIQVFTVERRLYRPDSIPWPSILTESNQEKLRARFRLSQLAEEATPLGAASRIVAPRGEFCLEGKPYLLEQLVLEPSALQAQVSADSHIADAFLEDVIRFLREVDSKGTKLEASDELARTYQTIAIAKLAVPFGAIFADSTGRFLHDAVMPRVSRPDAAASIRLASLSWLVSYETKKTGYSLTPKPLTIEPRTGTEPGDMIYYTVSPSDYETHLEILEAFERAVSITRDIPGRTRVRAKRSGR